MENFSPLSALLGGLMIGAAMSMLFWFNGRIAGISGMLGSALNAPLQNSWRLMFLAGMVVGGFLYLQLNSQVVYYTSTASLSVMIVGGLLVGFGTRMGNGCTSGHGVFGLARFSKRSIVATALFMTSAGLTVYVVRHLLG